MTNEKNVPTVEVTMEYLDALRKAVGLQIRHWRHGPYQAARQWRRQAGRPVWSIA
jgi:hypothetical protein